MTAERTLDPAVTREIHRASDGWAAGIVLMREHLARAGALDTTRCFRKARKRCSRISPARSSSARARTTSAR